MNLWGILIGILFIGIGVGLALGIDIWQYFFPIVIILIGLSIIFHQFRKPSSHPMHGHMGQTLETNEDTLHYSFSFSGGDFKVTTNDFKGGKISTFFGGANIDMRDAKIAKGKTARLYTDNVFGGTKIIVPKTWKVEGSFSGFLGGFHNATVIPAKPEATLIVKGTGTLGGGEITNEME